MSNAPVWGLVFYVNPPVLPPIAPGRGVVGHYIDRCIVPRSSCLFAVICAGTRLKITWLASILIKYTNIRSIECDLKISSSKISREISGFQARFQDFK